MYKLKKEKCIIIGPSGSGKNFLMDGFIELGLKPCVKITTRPKRLGEIEAKDYFFVDKEDFLNKLNNNEILVYQNFSVKPLESESQVWYYGLTKDSFELSDVVILTPKEYNIILSKYQRDNFFVVYLDIDLEIRKKRLISRNDSNDSINRRLESDDLDFNLLYDYDLRITDPEFSASDIYSLIM